MPAALGACRNGGIYPAFSMEKCGNIGVWVLSKELAVAGLQLRGISSPAAAPGSDWNSHPALGACSGAGSESPQGTWSLEFSPLNRNVHHLKLLNTFSVGFVASNKADLQEF